jgi:PPOX class probable F420-dependent enzyme
MAGGAQKVAIAGRRGLHHLAERVQLMSTAIEGRSAELLRAKNFAHVATINPSGTVHDVPVWIDLQDGRPALNTAEGRRWPRNLERDPRLTVTVQNWENPYEYVEIRGRVAERTQDGADEHIDALAKKYLGQDQYPGRQPGEQRVIIRVEPEQVLLRGS